MKVKPKIKNKKLPSIKNQLKSLSYVVFFIAGLFAIGFVGCFVAYMYMLIQIIEFAGSFVVLNVLQYSAILITVYLVSCAMVFRVKSRKYFWFATILISAFAMWIGVFNSNYLLIIISNVFLVSATAVFCNNVYKKLRSE